jgi:glutamate/tyrosine decarboxylase-like PLP-dependent enzyme
MRKQTLDPADWGAFRTQAHAMLDDLLGYTESICERPVWQPIPAAVRESFATGLPLGPTELTAVHAEFLELIVPYTAANGHPGFFGWAQGGGTPVGMLAEMMAAGLNANVGGRDQIPLEVERQVTGWMRDLFGFPAAASGILLTGSSMANFVAVIVARDARLGVGVRREGMAGHNGRLTAYASTAVHGSVDKALDLAGLGSDCLRKVAADARGRIDLQALARAIATDREAGCVPFLVVGTAGTVDTGAIDDLAGLADLCAREQLWFHVDGALGALGVLAPSLRARLAAIERADSLAFDFHKWGQVPYDAGFLLVRDGALHRQAFASAGAYLAREENGLAAGATWPCDLGPELSRSFRALKVWTTLKVYGTEAMGEMIEGTCELADYLKACIEANPELELMAPVELNVVCFRYRFESASQGCEGLLRDENFESIANALTRQLVVRLQEAGEVAPSTTLLQGRVAIRAAIVNHRTSRAEIDALVRGTLVTGRALRPEVAVAVEQPWKPRSEREHRVAQLDSELDLDRSKDREIALRVERAMLLAQVGRPLEARSDHLRVLELDPTHRVNLLELGRLLVATGQNNAAKVVYAEAVKHYPEDVVCRVNLGSVLLVGEDPAGALEQYGAALALNPELPQAHGGMYYALTRLGQVDAAAQHRAKAFGRKNLFVVPYRGDGEPVQVVLLVASTGGNTPIEKLLDAATFQTHVLVADFYDPAVPLPEHQLIFNGIGDVEVAEEALLGAEKLLAGTSAPVLNAPAAVLATSRCRNARRLAGLPGVRTAKTASFAYEALAGEQGHATLAEAGFAFPLLLRAPGFHMGQHFVQLESAEALAGQLATLPGAGRPGTEVLAIEYLDARGEDGCARKYRVMIVGGELYPLHLAVSPNWKIHYFSADMKDRPDHRAEEERFLTDMPTVLGSRAMAALRAIRDTIALDYGGIDFGLSRDGEVLVFEANATMVVEQPDDDPRWDYRRKAVERIHGAVRRMLLHSAAQNAAAHAQPLPQGSFRRA